MADVFTPENRSQIMSRIRGSGTTPEARLANMEGEQNVGSTHVSEAIQYRSLDRIYWT
jgi:G:T-mismatch repair DNA endonuclease (very short patch repair protein)